MRRALFEESLIRRPWPQEHAEGIRSRIKPRGWLIAAFALGYCFEVLFVSLNTFSLFDYTYSIALLQHEQPLSTIESFTQWPVILQILGGDKNTLSSVTQTPHRFRKQDRENLYWIDNNPEKSYYQPERRANGCVPLASWQDELHPSCLHLHHIDFGEISHVAEGNMRDTWLFREYNGDKRALKMLRALNAERSHEFDYVNTDRHRRDAVASEELSSSPYIADIYGYCSNSAVFDFADGGHLWTIFNSPRADGPEVPPTKDELFEYAHDAAMALADTHHLDSEGQITIIHNDIKPSQFIKMPNGRYQLNDFNGCIFPSWDPARNTYCNGHDIPEKETYDIFHLGQLFNFMLRGKRPYDDPTTVTSPINSTHPFDIYVKWAMNMCMRKRHSTAQQIARFVHAGYSKFETNTKSNVTNVVSNFETNPKSNVTNVARKTNATRRNVRRR